MSARLEKTRTPGIFKRGSRYVFSYRVDGKQRWESAARSTRRAERRQHELPISSAASSSSTHESRFTSTRKNGSSATKAPAAEVSERRPALNTGRCSTSMR